MLQNKSLQLSDLRQQKPLVTSHSFCWWAFEGGLWVLLAQAPSCSCSHMPVGLQASQGLLGAGGLRSSQVGAGCDWGAPNPLHLGLSTGMFACPRDMAPGFPWGG